MIDKRFIEQLIAEKLSDTNYFLVGLTISSDNAISVEIDSNEGVDIAFCVVLNKQIEKSLDREIEDFSLEVGSSGLTSPFKVFKQYEKNIGNEVEVLAKDGVKYKGVLLEVSESSFIILETKMIKKEGDKRKSQYQEARSFNCEDVKSTKYIINFK